MLAFGASVIIGEKLMARLGLLLFFAWTLNAQIMSLDGMLRVIEFKCHVDVDIKASEEQVNNALEKQIKMAFSALSYGGIILANIENPLLDINIVDTNKMLNIKRVSYHYHGIALVANHHQDLKKLSVTLIAGDIQASMMEKCASRDFDLRESENFWYYYRPHQPACQQLIAELSATFIDTTVHLFYGNDQALNSRTGPPYDELFALEAGRSQLVIYLLSSAEIDSAYPYDRFALEYVKTLNKILQSYVPNNLEEFIYYQEIFKIILEQRRYPHEVSARAIKEIAQKWLCWDLVLTIDSHPMPVQIRSFFGNDMQNSESQASARARFKEAFDKGDLIIYHGHGYLGEGSYRALEDCQSDFTSRYRMLFINSCYSFSHHAQTSSLKRLDLVLNGSLSYIENSGLVNAALVLSILKRKNFIEILLAMKNATSAPTSELHLIDRVERRF